MTTPLTTAALRRSWLNAVPADRRPERAAAFDAWLAREAAHPNPGKDLIPETREVRRYYASARPERAAEFDAWYAQQFTSGRAPSPVPPITDGMLLAALNAETRRERTRLEAYPEDHIQEMRAALTAALAHQGRN